MATPTLARSKPTGKAAGGKDAKAPAEEPKGGGLGAKKLVIIVLAALLAGGGAWYFVLRSPGPPPKPQAGSVLKMDSININLADGHYLKLGIALQAVKGAPSDLDGSQALDLAISQLSGRKMSDLASPATREKAKKALVGAVTKAYGGTVMDVYLTEFVMQ
jgi:flagellar FliL protein